MNKLSRYIKRLFNKDYDYLIDNLRKDGAEIGKVIVSGDITIDRNWPFLLHIGDYVHLTNGVTILNHDFSWSVIKRKEALLCGGVRPVYIGDNVFIGNNAVILMGTYIGDNSIVGAGSIVHGHFPSESVIAGNPAKVICSLEEYSQKRIKSQLCEATDIVRMYRKIHKQNPPENLIAAYSWLWTARTEFPPYLLKKMKIRDNFEETMHKFMTTKPLFESYDTFLNSIS